MFLQYFCQDLPGMAVQTGSFWTLSHPLSVEHQACSCNSGHLYFPLSFAVAWPQKPSFIWSTVLNMYWKRNEIVGSKGKYSVSPTTLGNCFPLNCFSRGSTTVSLQNILSPECNHDIFYYTELLHSNNWVHTFLWWIWIHLDSCETSVSKDL